MSWLRTNLFYVIIVILVLFLLLFTIRLQFLMLQVQPGAQPATGAQVVAVAATPTPTAAVAVVAVLPTAPLLPTPTALPPTATFTATPLPPTMTPTMTPTPLALSTASATAPPLPPVDFRLGYLDRGDDCPVITTIVQAILENELGYRVASVPFSTPDELFAMLTADNREQKIDWTMCYLDPTDRPFLQKYGGFFVVIGGIYWRADGNNYQIMANGLRKKAIQQEQPCLYGFLKNFTLENAPVDGQTATTWVAEHQALVQSWVSCQ